MNLMILYPLQANGNLSRYRILKGYRVACLTQLNMFLLIVYLAVLMIVTRFGAQNERYTINSVIFHHSHVMIDIYVHGA